MEVFVHSMGAEHPEIIEVDATLLVRELLADDQHDVQIWLEDVDEAISPDATLAAAGIGHHHHVHRGHCRRVAVVIRFNGTSYERSFAPGTTIKKVEKWAFGPHAANLSPEQAAKHVLAVPGADHFLEDGVHIGSLVTSGGCEITLDLLPRARFEG